MYRIPKKEISKDNLLMVVSQEDIFSFYLGMRVELNCPKFCSPLRRDDTPTCSLFLGQNGNVYMKDFSGHFFGDCFTLVQHLNQCSFYECLITIDKDMGLGLFGSTAETSTRKFISDKDMERTRLAKVPTRIAVSVKKMSYQDEVFWSQFGITKELLDFYKVYAISKYRITSDLKGPTMHIPRQIAYAYFIRDRIKVYVPGEKKEFKFCGNTTNEYVQGLSQIPLKPKFAQVGIITKSLKDIMTLLSMGIWSIAPNSETALVPDSAIETMKSRFKHVVILYDNDETGIEYSIKLSKEKGLPYTLIPDLDYKDISDFRKEHTKEETVELLKTLLEDYL